MCFSRICASSPERVFSFRQPFWILLMPDQRVTANFHAVPGREIHNLVALRKIERLRLRMHHLPLEDVFRFQHIEFARERERVCRLGKLSWPDCGADEQSRSLSSLTQRLLTERRRQIPGKRLPIAKDKSARHFMLSLLRTLADSLCLRKEFLQRTLLTLRL